MTAAAWTLAVAITQVPAGDWTAAPPLPTPVANNAVAAAPTATGPALFSFMGLDATKEWNGLTSRAFRWDVGSPAWREVTPVPGPGRLAGTAQEVGGRIYVFGGYTVAEDGTETSVPSVDVYDPDADLWTSAAPMPVPVDDAVSGVWRDSLVYLVSGWHDEDNVANVQIYDPATDRWRQATPVPGPPVFGHAGAVAGDYIVYVDGVAVTEGRPRFRIEASSWLGRIDPADPATIHWTRLPDHPGPPLYRAASGSAGDWVLWAGGTDNPYNFNGIGYDGRPASPRAGVFGYHVETGVWRELEPLAEPSMDHRGLVAAGGRLYVIGGMKQDQAVTADVVGGTPLGR